MNDGCTFGNPSFVTVNDSITKCWINQCEGQEGVTWTLTPPEDIKDALIAWSLLSVAILFTVICNFVTHNYYKIKKDLL